MPIVISHLRLVHANDPNFSVSCGIEGCYRTFKSFSSFYQHIYRKHPDTGIIRTRKEQYVNVVHPAQPMSPHAVEPIPEGKNIANQLISDCIIIIIICKGAECLHACVSWHECVHTV